MVQALLKRFNAKAENRHDGPPIRAFAHITGGGFFDNVPRVIPKQCDVVICKGTWDIPPIFQYIAQKGGLGEAELYHVFNMGIGMVAIVAPDQVDAVHKAIKASHRKAWLIGEVVPGSGETRLE
jgi:phosphoribosylformylglycinamidine cyclo-ligase